MIPSNMKEMLKEIKYIFTKEYQKECQHIEFQQSMKDKVKLRCDADESIDEKIARIRANNFKSNCRINCSSLNNDGLMSDQLYMESPFPKADPEECMVISDDELIKLFEEISSSLGFEYEQPNDNNKKTKSIKL